MNRRDLITAISLDTGYRTTDIDRILAALVDNVIVTVSSGERVLVAGFGVFEPVVREARKARNPRKNTPVEVPETVAPRFRAGSKFVTSVRNSLTIVREGDE